MRLPRVTAGSHLDRGASARSRCARRGDHFTGCAAFERPDARDARITSEVRALIAQNGSLEAPNQVDVQSRNGVVYLHGLVDTPFEQALAGSPGPAGEGRLASRKSHRPQRGALSKSAGAPRARKGPNGVF